jgi:hypothetical protein
MIGLGINKLSPSSGDSNSTPPCVLPDNKIVTLQQTGTGTFGIDPPYTIKSYTFQYDPIKENIMTVELHEELFTSDASFSGRNTTRCNNGNAAICIFGEYPLPSESAYRYGIALINGNGEALTPTEVLNEQPTSTYSNMTITTGFEGSIYTVLHTSTSYPFLFEKWLPIIRKDSPLKYGHDVRIITSDSTGITLDSTYLDQRVTYDFASTTLNVTVPPNSSDPLPIGFRCSFSRLNTGTVTFVAGSGVTIVSADSYLSLGATGSLAEITKVDTNTWLLTGDLA